MVKIILFTGKGGVGKTVIAAATGLSAAKRGYRTLVMSTDPAHSLGDSLDLRLGPEPIEIMPNLWAQESDINYNLQKYWGKIQGWLIALFAWQGLDEVTAEELTVFPGMDELASLLLVYFHHQSGQYDTIVVDCAPTGEALRFLTFPEVAKWWMAKFLPIGKRLVSPLVHLIYGMPLPDKKAFDDAENLRWQLGEIRSLLIDPNLTRIRLVANPEKMVIRESQRAYTDLNLFNYPVDLLICNKIIPEEAAGSYWEEWKKRQEEYLKFIEECFSPLPMLKVPLLKHEVVGVETIQEIAELLYGKEDPTRTFFERKGIAIQRENSDYLLTLELPFIEKGDISLLKTGEELVVRISNLKRNILLPPVLSSLKPAEAKLEEGYLQIRFKKVESAIQA
jgi:arsenite-transporting ATPase